MFVNIYNLINKINILNFSIKFVILVLWIYLYYIGSLTLNRIIIFIIVFILIYGYSRFNVLIIYIFLNKNVIKYVQNHNETFHKIVYVLFAVHRWINPMIYFLTYTDKLLYKINRYVTGTKFIRYNFAIYMFLKYILFFGLIKLIIYKYYNLWYKLYHLSLIDILFNRMYGLILSILIFTDLFNNIINVLSQYGFWIYIVIYYVISILCIIWELLFYYYLCHKVSNRKIVYLIILFQCNFQEYTKMCVIIYLRSQFTFMGRIITDILLRCLIPEEQNLKQQVLHLIKITAGGGFMSGRINYYIPVNNRISLKYFEYFGGYRDLAIFEPTFELYWKSFKSNLDYLGFFRPISEIKHKPSIFLYTNILKLLKLYDLYNQPINRLMNWRYFKMKYKEFKKDFNEDEQLIITRNLKYFNEIDGLRARLMFFIMWDIEYFYNNNDKDYQWNYWILQYDSIAEKVFFLIDERFDNKLLSRNLSIANKCMSNNKGKLKFYDPEENMEFLNRLFDVIGILDIRRIDSYYVSKKFINYNKKYVELLTIMYTYDHKRWEEPLCECNYLSNYEVDIAYKTEDFMQKLRLEWKESIETVALEERNWKLLKRLEDLMG